MVAAVQERVQVPLSLPEPDYALGSDWGNGRPDPEALDAVRALQELWPDCQVVLFGSRAVGNWRPWSDLDIAVIGVSTDDRAAETALREQASEHLRMRNIPVPWIQLNAFTHRHFDAWRTSLPHLAGQVQRKGIQSNGEPMPPVEQNNPWPGVQARLRNTRHHLHNALRDLGHEDFEGTVRHAHTAVENILKGALGLLGVETVIDSKGRCVGTEKAHDLVGLFNGMPDEYRDWLTGMPDPRLQAELTTFRLIGDYSGDDLPWPSVSAAETVAIAQAGCGRLAGILLRRLGKTPREVGYRPDQWLADTPLAGWESAPLDYFEQDRIDERRLARMRVEGIEIGEARGEARGEERGIEIGRDLGRAEGVAQGQRQERLAGAAALLPALLGESLDAGTCRRIVRHWETHGVPADYAARLLAVQRDPDRWAERLGIPAVEPPPPRDPARPPPQGQE